MRVLKRAAAAALTALLAIGGIVAVGIAPANAATLSFSGTIAPSDPVRGYACGGSNASSYDAQPFVVSVSGTYDLAMTSPQAGDLYYSLHRDSIGGACIAQDDDSNGGLRPRIATTLTAGVQYVLVTTNWSGGTGATVPYTNTISGPGDVILGSAVSTTIAPAAAQQSTLPLSFTATFSEDVTGLDASDVVVTGGLGSPTVSLTGSGASYAILVSGTGGSTTVGVTLQTGAASAGARPSLPATATTRYAPAPTATIQQAAGQADPTGTLPVAFDVRFSEAVSGFSADDVLVGGSAGGSGVTVTGSGAAYVVRVTDAQLPGTIDVAIPDGAAVSGFGVASKAATTSDASVTFLPAPPTATIAPVAETSTTVPIAFSVEFSGPVQGFDAADVILGGTASPAGASVTGSGASYVVSVADAASAGTVTAQVRALAATRYGLANQASNVATSTFAPPRPTVTLEQAAAQSDPTPEPTASFDIVFSESVTGLEASDLVLGGTAGATTISLSGSGATYVATVSGVVRPGTVTLALGEAAATSRFGETSLAATSVDAEVTFDPGTPALAIERADGQDATTTLDEVRLDATFSQPVTGFDADDVVLGGDTGGVVTVTGSGADYAIVVSGLQRAGTVSVSVGAGAATSAFGVPSAAATTVDATVTFEPVRPSVTVEQGAAQPDPADVDGFVFDVAFSQPVTGLEASDVVVAGDAGASVVALEGEGAAYVVTVSGAVRPGTVSISIPEGAATGAFETTSLPSTSVDAEVAFAPPAPTVTVEQAADQPDPASTEGIAFDVVFSHDVAGLGVDDLVVGGTASDAFRPSLTGEGAEYRVLVFGLQRPGTVTVAIAAGAAVDRYGMESAASTSEDAEVTFAPPAPVATITRAAGQAAVANGQPFVFDVTFSVPVSGLEADDVVVAGDTGASIVEVEPAGTPQSGDAIGDVAAADGEVLYDWTVRVSGATTYGTVAIGLREGAVQSGYGVASLAAEPTLDSTVLYAPAVVTPMPSAPAPVAPAPSAPAPVAPAPTAHASLPRTGADASWTLVLAAMLLVAAGGALRRGSRAR